MSIDGKHAYRFGYLKSDKWKQVRLDAILREKGKCQICQDESIFNDAHHIWYPENIYETKEFHLVILCRACHEFVHVTFPECKTNNEDDGREIWLKFYRAVVTWRTSKLFLFSEDDCSEHLISPLTPKELREAHKQANKKLRRAVRLLSENGIDFDSDVKSEIQEMNVEVVCKIIRKWYQGANCVNKEFADSDFSI